MPLAKFATLADRPAIWPSRLAEMANLAGTPVAKGLVETGRGSRPDSQPEYRKETAMLALRFNNSALDEMFDLAKDFEPVLTGQGGNTQRRSAWTPAVEVDETDDVVSMAVELPGV